MKTGDFAREAAAAVDGAKADEHGDLRRTFANTAALWNAWLAIRKEPAAPLDGHDVAQMMSLLKKARTQTGSDNPDDYVDDCGYATIAGALALGGKEVQEELDLEEAISWWGEPPEELIERSRFDSTIEKALDEGEELLGQLLRLSKERQQKKSKADNRS